MDSTLRERVVKCQLCDKYFGYSPEQIKCPFCDTAYNEIDEKMGEDNQSTKVRHIKPKEYFKIWK